MAAKSPLDYITPAELNSMTDEEIFNYIFIKGNKDAWHDDYINEVGDNERFYPLQISLMGDVLNLIVNKIYNKTSPWMPKGYKLNPKIIYILEKYLAENTDQVRDASLSSKTNKHVSGSCDRLITAMKPGFDYDKAKNATVS